MAVRLEGGALLGGLARKGVATGFVRNGVAIAVALGGLSAPSRALAYCRAVSIQVPPGQDPSQTGVCFPGPGVAVDLTDAGCAAIAEPSGIFDEYWPTACIGYSLQRNASSRFPLDQATAIVRQAFDTWQNAPCGGGTTPSFQALDNGPVDCDQVGYNRNAPNQHVVIFHDDMWPYNDPLNTLGLTTLQVDRCTGEIVDADIEINTTSAFNLVATPADLPEGGALGTYDLLSIITHEAGHFLGLAHSTDKTAIMYALYASGSASLQPDDVAGICDVYLANNARAITRGAVDSTACDNGTPRNGFSTQCDAPSVKAVAPPPPATANVSGCATGGRAGRGAGAFAAVGLLAWAGVARRLRARVNARVYKRCLRSFS